MMNRMARYLFENDEHRALREQARRWAAAEIRPHAEAWEEAGLFPRELHRSAAAAGLLGVGYPEDLGGSGGDVTHLCVVQEEMVLAGTSPGTVAGLGSHGIALPPLLALGTEAQRRRLVPPVLSGERIAALAVTEPGGGSDVAALATRAVLDGDAYVVDGTKSFITSGTRADLVVAAVRTGGPGHLGISLLAVERGTPGFGSSGPLRKTGWWASDTAILTFEGCRVPRENLIGEENQGFAALAASFAGERLLLAAQCVAIGELALRESVAWARERRAFGRTLAGFQVIRHRLADMATRLAAARALAGELAVRAARGEQVPGLAAMAKNAASDACSWICDQAVQIHGGQGYMRGAVVERLFRDARLYPIGGGTREIMNEVIGRSEGF
jgi:acyl-CoA dehydrogenase